MCNTSEKDVHVPMQARVDVKRQVLEILRGETVEQSYPISTSKYGIGFEPGSNKTPVGRFIVGKKIGEGEPAGSVFKSRCPTGEICMGGGDDDLVLTRILWLEGVEDANANTWDRYIYIHGTNREDLIGTPASHGCVRMRNADVADLFEKIPEGTPVEIVA